MISFKNVAYTYTEKGLKPAVKGINLDVEKGGFYFLTGASGAGKTTLFKMLYMDLLPTFGSVTLFGKNVSMFTKKQIALTRRHIGIVFQDFRLLEHLTVRENVALPLSLHGKLTMAQERSVDEILKWVGLGHKLEAYPNALSGGEKQRVSIARAVVNRPKLLIADEPTGNVDDAMGERIMHLFTELNKHGTTVVVATHDMKLVEKFSFPRLHLEDGRCAVIQPTPRNNQKQGV